jgi:hypothetical protein
VDAFNVVALRLNALHDLSQLLASISLEQVLDGTFAMRHIIPESRPYICLTTPSGWSARAAGPRVRRFPRVCKVRVAAEALRETEVEVHHLG